MQNRAQFVKVATLEPKFQKFIFNTAPKIVNDFWCPLGFFEFLVGTSETTRNPHLLLAFGLEWVFTFFYFALAYLAPYFVGCRLPVAGRAPSNTKCKGYTSEKINQMTAIDWEDIVQNKKYSLGWQPQTSLGLPPSLLLISRKPKSLNIDCLYHYSLKLGGYNSRITTRSYSSNNLKWPTISPKPHPRLKQGMGFGTKNVNIKGDLKSALNPIKVYNNLKDERLNIYKEQKGKSGIYCLINIINENCYIGSSINLASRMINYLNNSNLKSRQNDNMPIVKALLRYGQSNFTCLILEYVKPESLAIRETFYITHIIPYYNVLKVGGCITFGTARKMDHRSIFPPSSLGYKHTEETKKLLSLLAKNRTHSDKTKSLIAKAVAGENNPFYNKNHSMETKVRILEAKSSYPVYLYNSFKELLVIFPSATTLAKLIKANQPTLVNFIKDSQIFRGEWYLTNVPYNISDKPNIANWQSKQCEELILNIKYSSHIIKAIFVYDDNKNFVYKYDGVMAVQKDLKISHCTVKNYAKIGGTYKGYIFSYERLINSG